MKRRLTTAAAAAALLTAGAAAAHDFFLLPQTFTGSADRPLIVHATSSSDFPDPDVGPTRERLGEFAAVVGGRAANVVVQAQTPKTLRLAVSSPRQGLGVITVQTPWRDADWGPELVETYLEEHPFRPSDVAAARRLLPEPRTLKVRSRRLAKTFACFTSCTPGGSGAAGLEVEFVAEVGQPGTFRLLRDGRPLAGQPVTVRPAVGERRTVVTDAGGHVRLPAGTSGAVMLLAATLDPPAETGGRFTARLASLTFDTGSGVRGTTR